MKKQWITPELEELDVKKTMFGFGSLYCKLFPWSPLCHKGGGGDGGNGDDDNIFDS